MGGRQRDVVWMLFALRAGDFSWDLASDVDVIKAGLAEFIPLTVFLVDRRAGVSRRRRL